MLLSPSWYEIKLLLVAEIKSSEYRTTKKVLCENKIVKDRDFSLKDKNRSFQTYGTTLAIIAQNDRQRRPM